MSLMQTLANHYDLLPPPVREAYLLARIADVTAHLDAVRCDRDALQTALVALERENAQLIVAADLDTQKSLRLERQLDAERQSVAGLERLLVRQEQRSRVLLRQCARLRDQRDTARRLDDLGDRVRDGQAGEIDELTRALQAARDKIARLSESRFDLFADGLLEGAISAAHAARETETPDFPPTPEEILPFTPEPEPAPLRCPHCQASQNSRGEPLTEFSLKMHIHRCAANPHRARSYRHAPPLPVPTPEPLPAPEAVAAPDAGLAPPPPDEQRPMATAPYGCACGQSFETLGAWRRHAMGPSEPTCRQAYAQWVAAEKAARQQERSRAWQAIKAQIQTEELAASA